MNCVLLISTQGVNKGQTATILESRGILVTIKIDGLIKLISIPRADVCTGDDELDFPRCQDVYTIWKNS